MAEMGIPSQAYDMNGEELMEVIKNEGVQEEALGDKRSYFINCRYRW